MQQAGSNGPSSDQLATFLGEYTELKTKAQRVAQQIGTCIKNFESIGGDGADLKDLHKLMKLDTREAQARIERRYRYAAQVGLVEVEWDAEGQSTFAKIFADVKPAVGDAAQQLAGARAYTDGYNSGNHGAAVGDSPHNGKPGSIEYVQWREGWTDGHVEWVAKDPSRAERETVAATEDTSMPATPTPEPAAAGADPF